MLKLLAMACVTHMLPKTYTKHTNTHLCHYHTHTMRLTPGMVNLILSPTLLLYAQECCVSV